MKERGANRWLLSNTEEKNLATGGWRVNNYKNLDSGLERSVDDDTVDDWPLDDGDDRNDYWSQNDDDKTLLYPSWAKTVDEVSAAYPNSQWQFQDCTPLGTANLTGDNWYQNLVSCFEFLRVLVLSFDTLCLRYPPTFVIISFLLACFTAYRL